MENLVLKEEEIEEWRDGFSYSIKEKCRESSRSSEILTWETSNEEKARFSSEESDSSLSFCWPLRKNTLRISSSVTGGNGEGEKAQKIETEDLKISEIGTMKERFSKLLLGEDMSGSGKGVCTALAISNAITNLYATLFGQLWTLEPLPPQKRAMWRREMEWLLRVTDYIVELIPSWQTFPDGSNLEVMTCRPRPDLHINLPALHKLDNMLLETLDSFSNAKFWYVDQGILAPKSDGSASFCWLVQRQENWWLPLPRVPPNGLDKASRKNLQHKRECTNQILKAAMAINNNALDEMEIPESYLRTLPKNARACLGDVMHQYLTSDQVSPECLLLCLDLSSEHTALEIANRIEASIHVWQRRTTKSTSISSHGNSKLPWEIVKELMVDTDKRELLAERAENLLLCLKQKFPGLPHTTLEMSKIQHNKDVGKSILESYSRVLESMAFNIVSRIDDVLYIDDLCKKSDKISSDATATARAHERVSIPLSVPPYTTALTTSRFNTDKFWMTR